MDGQPFRVLFISQRNCARGMMAEAIANTITQGKLEAYSAGVTPAGCIDPVAAELLQHAGIETPRHPPQHVHEFSSFDSPPMDFVFTLSDPAAGELRPTWPGHPITAHWHSTDPERFATDAEKRLALIRTRSELERRLRLLVNLPAHSLDHLSAQPRE